DDPRARVRHRPDPHPRRRSRPPRRRRRLRPDERKLTMATLDTIGGGTGPQIFVGVESGLTVVAPGTPLTRLNYYDGKFLRADDLDVEQAYFRSLAWLSNVAGGSGVAYGFDVAEGNGDTISLSPGL